MQEEEEQVIQASFRSLHNIPVHPFDWRAVSFW